MAKIKDLGNKSPNNDRNAPQYIVRNMFDEVFGLLMNALKIEGVNYPEEQLIKRQLILTNKIGYDGITKIYYPAIVLEEKNDYNLPRYAIFTSPKTNLSFQRTLSYEPNIDGAFLLYGLPTTITFAEIIRQHTDVIEQCDVAIRQNLEASSIPAFVVVEDTNQRLAVEHAIEQKQVGMPYIVVGTAVAEAMRSVQVNTPIIFDKIYQFRQQVLDSLYNKLSIMTANVEKRERIQAAEVNATVGKCEDYLYMLIDNFNRQAESYGLKLKMRSNTALEELYYDEENNNDV